MIELKEKNLEKWKMHARKNDACIEYKCPINNKWKQCFLAHSVCVGLCEM